MEQIIQIDKDAFLYLNNLGNPSWDDFWRFVSYKFTWIPFYILLFVLLIKHLGWKKAMVVLVLTLFMILISDQVTNIIKDSVKRLRPCFTKEFEGLIRPIGCERRGQFGFTSAHASNHFALALLIGMVLRKKIKWLIYVLLIWAAIIAYSRVYLGVHFPLDILCGGILGLIISTGFYYLYKAVERKWDLDPRD